MHKLFTYIGMFILLPASIMSQSDKITYAITSESKGSSDWIALRSLNVKSGKFSQMLLNMNDRGLLQNDEATHRLNDKITLPFPVLPGPVHANKTAPIINSGVAAVAYDQRTNRLFYVPMNDDILRYIDLATMKVYAEPDLSFSKAGNYTFKSTSPINRLVITPDGYGYTVTDGSRLIRFTTNDKPSLTDLGELKDDPHNKEMTVIDPCSNVGGDMVADDAGNLYLITARNRVYKIDIKTRVTKYLTTIAGLPEAFITSGAAINENGNLLVGSSIYTEASFIVDHKTWKASPSPIQQLFGVADLASSNVLQTKKAIPSIISGKPLVKTGYIRIYPNPVLFDEINVQFNDLPAGKYTIELADPLGRKVLHQKVMVTRQTQTSLLQIPTITAQAFYYVRILNEKNIPVSTHKLAVERW